MTPIDGLWEAMPEVVSREVGGELVLLDLDTQHYFRLNEVGARTWQLLTGERTLAATAAILAAEFEVEPAIARRDAERLIGELRAAGLLRPAR
jgi:hypothetical protein